MFGLGKNNAAIDAFADGLADEIVSRFSAQDGAGGQEGFQQGRT
jgi:hypothetical protein